MLHHLGSILAFIHLFLFVSQTSAVQFASSGQGTLVGYGTTIYTAVQYRPVCGTLTLSARDWPSPWMMSDICNSAMVSYRSIEETFKLYDLTGVMQPDVTPIAQGTAFCMCFSLAETGDTGRSGDFCLMIGSTGEQVLYWSLRRDYTTVGIYQVGNKALPQCSAYMGPTTNSTSDLSEG